ncbi:hypothetical protein FACS1894122_15320 [Alphaproteobacteria bacterium]|nr:hypothetical protein FACS1894122_15320 [Alphaproteobacteria bacterium]
MNMVIAADNDKAGLKAANEALQILDGNGQIISPIDCNDFNEVLTEHGSDKVLSYFQHLIKGTKYD